MAARAPCGFLSRIVAFHKTWLSILVLFLLYSTSTNAFYGLSGPRRSQFVSVLYASTPSKLPVVGSSFYAEVRKQATEAVQAGLKAGFEQMEIEFPISPGRIDVSLGEFLDDSREWTREFVRPFTPKGAKLWVIFPDGKEATLAGKRWGGVNFRIMGIDTAMKASKDEPCELQIAVTPGFNVQEYINLEKVRRPGVPMIVVNGNLDRIRGGYYPRIFYPGLYNVKERMLQYFEPVYYLKPAQGGFIFRKFPEEWQQVLAYYDLQPGTGRGRGDKGRKEVLTKVVATSEERPAYNDVVNALKKESLSMARAAQEAQEAAEREAG